MTKFHKETRNAGTIDLQLARHQPNNYVYEASQNLFIRISTCDLTRILKNYPKLKSYLI